MRYDDHDDDDDDPRDKKKFESQVNDQTQLEHILITNSDKSESKQRRSFTLTIESGSKARRKEKMVQEHQ